MRMGPNHQTDAVVLPAYQGVIGASPDAGTELQSVE
jgi:hypothetical protein